MQQRHQASVVEPQVNLVIDRYWHISTKIVILVSRRCCKHVITAATGQNTWRPTRLLSACKTSQRWRPQAADVATNHFAIDMLNGRRWWRRGGSG